MHLKLKADIVNDLACPICKISGVRKANLSLQCCNQDCAAVFPVIDACPILINEVNSVFSLADYESRSITTMDLRDGSEKRTTLWKIIRFNLAKLTPPVSRSVNDFSVRKAINEICLSVNFIPRILVIGSGEADLGAQAGCDLIYTDVAIGQLTQLVCDAHDIPFAAEYFDAVVAVAVLEHVADPYRCADEMYRVLKPQGFVYSVTPFMQQVHMGRYDFTRFTHLGHRRLFRRFTEERSGVANAQGTALAWSIERFISGFSESAGVHSKLRTFARFFASPFLIFDKILARKATAYDAASAYYFFGRKSDQVLSDRELVRGYRGMS